MEPGVHETPAVDYHADPCAQPSLTASIASLLCSASPLHAWTAHPRLNPNFKREERAAFDLGTVAHDVLLEGLGVVEVVDAPDWRTKVAQEARDAARAAGRVPLLLAQFKQVEEMVDAIHRHLLNHGATPPLFTDGKAEQTLVWEEPGGVICRARPDWIRDDLAAVDDLKTTSRSASPEAYSRRLFGIGGDVQAAFYLRGVEALTHREPTFRWCVVESQPPFALSVISPGSDVLTIGQKKVEFAIEAWRKCLRDDSWPGYATEVAYANLPAWEEAAWLEKELEAA